MSFRLGWLPLAIFTFVLGILISFQAYIPPIIFEPPLLALMINTLVVSSATVALAYISARGFLTYSAGLLLLGIGGTASGLISAMTFPLMDITNLPNLLVTINSSGLLLASTCHMVNVFIVFSEQTVGSTSKHRRLIVAVAYTAFLCIMTLVAISSFLQALPAFYIVGKGVTEIGLAVLWNSIILLVMSSVAFMTVHVKSKSTQLYWYSLALGLLALGSTASVLTKSSGSPMDWLARSAKCLASIYFLTVAYSALKTGHTITPVSAAPKTLEPREKTKDHLDIGHIYIIKDDVEKSYNVFSRNVHGGAEGLVITREHPSTIRHKYALKNTTIVWISSEKDEERTVSSLQDVSILIADFIEKSERGIVLLDGIEYLITNNGFETTLRFLQSKRSQMEVSNSIFIMPISPSAIQPEQYVLIQRETIVL